MTMSTNFLIPPLFLLFIAVSYTSCRDTDVPEGTPACIEEKIDDIMRAAVQNPPASVWQWDYEGAKYYYITSDCCDQFNYLYTETCEEYCAPDGGFTGAGDGRCLELYNNSDVEKTLIWEDER